MFSLEKRFYAFPGPWSHRYRHRQEVVAFLRVNELPADHPDFIKAMVAVRGIFLRVVHAEYWHMIENGFLPNDSHAASVLLHSTDVAEDHVSAGLTDWTYVADQLHSAVNPGIYEKARRQPADSHPGAGRVPL